MTYARIVPDRESFTDESYLNESLDCMGVSVIPIDGKRYRKFTTEEWDEIDNFCYLDFYYAIENSLPDDETGEMNESILIDGIIRALESNGKNADGETVRKWRDIMDDFRENGMNGETACRCAELYTGKKWDCAMIFGSVQGEVAMIYFPAIPDETKRKKFVDEAAAYWFNTGTEVVIFNEDREPDSPDEITYWDGLLDYVPIPFATTSEIKQYLANGYDNGNPDNVVLYRPSRQVIRWEYETE